MVEFETFPTEFAELYKQKGYWLGESLGSILLDWKNKDPNRVAIVEEEHKWTFAELDLEVNKFAAELLNKGIKANDRVVVQLPNVAMFAVVSIAMFRLGVIPVYALPNHRSKEIIYLCEYSEAVAYLTLDTFLGFDYKDIRDKVRETDIVKHIIVIQRAKTCPKDLTNVEGTLSEVAPPTPSSVAFFLLSGGTTGMPKLIPRTHDDYAYQLRETAKALNFDHDGVYLASLPIAHNAALGCPGLLGSLYVGGKTVLIDNPSPELTFTAVKNEGVTLTTLMPPLVLLWLESAEFFDVDLSNVVLQVGSARFAPELAKRVNKELGCTLTQWFGMAEGLLTYTRLDDCDEVVQTTQGKPLSPLDEVKACDSQGLEVPLGEVGELLTRGPYTLRGYYKAKEHNLKAFTPDGFLCTGDLVKFTPEGNMVVEGRIKDVINRGGEKIVTSEVEDLLINISNIREVALVPMPDRIMGEKICAFIVIHDNNVELKLDSVRAFLSDQGLADYKFPDRIEIIDAMPRTTVGKLNKAALTEQIKRKINN